MAPYKASVEQAVDELISERLIGFPTETVYGLAGRIDSALAIEKIFKFKNRPFFDPLIVHVYSIDQARSCVHEWPVEAELLAQKFWPGPLTLVLPKNTQIRDQITSGLDSVGLRCPAHPLALEILRKIKVPLAAPSANQFGKTSPTAAEHVLTEFPDQNLAVVDGGSCELGIESTVVLLKKNQFSILREGYISAEEIQKVLPNAKNLIQVLKKEAPGHMKHHYMPTKPLVVVARPDLNREQITELLLRQLPTLPDQVEGVSILIPKPPFKFIELNLPNESRLAARNLYSELRSSSQKDGNVLLFQKSNPKQQDPLWSAIDERLYKAATLILR